MFHFSRENKSGIRMLSAIVPLAAVGLAINAPANAQGQVQAGEEIFEEIVVTVQKREQNIMDVPIAVSALSGAQIEAAGIKDMFDLQQNVPGLIVAQSQTSTTTNFAIRGVGSTSNNFGVESSVGLYVDGVYRSRQSSLINDLADIETVEIARGPQGTLYGKNTPSGAISIRTVAPSHETDAFVDVTVGDLGLVKVTGAANWSMGENVAMRATVFTSERDGYVDDVNFGKNFYNDRDRQGIRLQLALNEPGDDFNMRVIADYAEIDEICCAAISHVDSLFYQQSLSGIPQNGSDAAIMALGGTIFTNFPYPQPFIDGLNAAFPQGEIRTGVPWDDFLVSYDTVPVSTNEDKGLSVEINRTFGNGVTLTSITGFRQFDTTDTIDGDFSNVPLLARVNDASQESISQELRLTGEFGEGSTYVAGIYYFGQDIDTNTFTGDAGLLGPYLGILQPDLQQIVDGVNLINILSGGLVPPAAEPFPAGVFADDTVSQDHQGTAVFGQVDWAVGDTVTLTFGARFTDEKKSIDSSFVQTAQGPPPDLDAIGLNLFLASQGQPFDPFVFLPVAQPNQAWGSYLFDPLAPRPDLNASLSDDQTTWTAKVTWFPTDSMMLYASYGTGFKSGGTNVDRINAAFNPIFDAETTESFEVGLKGDFGPVRLVLTYYQTDYEDFQAQSFAGGGFNLQNAGEIDTDGFEAEILWRPTDSTEIQAFYARSNGDFKSFSGGTCWDTYVVHTGVPDPGSGGDVSAEVCDHTGFKMSYNPEDRAFFAITQDFNIGRNTSMFVRGEYTYASSQFTDGDADPFTEQDDFDMINLRVGFNFDSWNANLTLWGRNITDERWYHGSFDTPISADRLNVYPSETESYGITFRKNFD